MTPQKVLKKVQKWPIFEKIWQKRGQNGQKMAIFRGSKMGPKIKKIGFFSKKMGIFSKKVEKVTKKFHRE